MNVIYFETGVHTLIMDVDYFKTIKIIYLLYFNILTHIWKLNITKRYLI